MVNWAVINNFCNKYSQKHPSNPIWSPLLQTSILWWADAVLIDRWLWVSGDPVQVHVSMCVSFWSQYQHTWYGWSTVPPHYGFGNILIYCSDMFDKHLFECDNVILLSKPHFCKDHAFLLNILWNHVWNSGDLWYPKASDASWWYSWKGLLFIIILLKLDVSTDGWVATEICTEWVLITPHLPQHHRHLIISSFAHNCCL